jgi:hypothetical protein
MFRIYEVNNVSSIEHMMVSHKELSEIDLLHSKFLSPHSWIFLNY